MSYEDLREGIAELFDDAAGMAPFQIEPYEPSPASVEKTQRIQAREDARLERAAAKAYDIIERGTLPWPRYCCARCASRSSTHRCPG